MAAIEDIDFLLENSALQQYLVMIDSSRRNRVAYPNPNEFVLEFSTPFRFVCGYDILDALIPTTMYNVETFNNTIIIGRIQSTRVDWQTTFSNGFFEEFAFVPEIAARFTDPTPGSLMIVEKTRLNDIGVSETVEANAPNDIAIWCVYSVQGSPRQDAMHQIRVEHNSDIWYLQERPAGTAYMSFGDSDEFGMVDVTIVALRHLSDLDAATVIQASAYDVNIIVSKLTLPIRSYDSRQLQQVFNTLLTDIGMSLSHLSPIPEQSNRYSWTSNDPFWFNMQASTCVDLLGFDELTVRNGVPETYQSMPPQIDVDRRMFVSIFDSSSFQFKIVSPGMLNMGGIPYVVLRIPELEDHAFAGESHHDMTVRGLGIFKLLATGGGISNLRFDYVNFTRRPWHPIGKLSRLTVRMERSNGVLYDFKGVNWSILLALKYMVPVVKPEKPRYRIGMLNSEYDPDAQAYYIRKRQLSDDTTVEYDEDDAEETLMRPMDIQWKEKEKDTENSSATIRQIVRRLVI